MRVVFSDGSSYNNGKPGCVAGFSGYMPGIGYTDGYEIESSSQRGELLGAISALRLAWKNCRDEHIIIVVDSSYVCNAINNGWVGIWKSRNWLTTEGKPVANRDLWLTLSDLVEKIGSDEVTALIIKGHIRKFKTEARNEQAVQEAYEKFVTKNCMASYPMDSFIKLIEGNEFVDTHAVAAKNKGLTAQQQDDAKRAEAITTFFKNKNTDVQCTK